MLSSSRSINTVVLVAILAMVQVYVLQICDPVNYKNINQEGRAVVSGHN